MGLKYMDFAGNKGSINQEGIPPLDDYAIDVNNLSMADQTVDYTDLIKDDVFIGSTPYETINECLHNQFNDYINLEDSNNYVDIFYDQLHASYEFIHSDDEEEHPMEKIEALDILHERFLNDIHDLFISRLSITIADLEDVVVSSIDKDEIEFIIRRLYEFFILGARNNFKVVIAMDIQKRMNINTSDDELYFRELENQLMNYSPLIKVVDPIQFLKYRGDEEITELYETGKVVGNFLRKYTPKLYQNDEYKVELINYITTIEQFKEDMNNGGSAT